MKFRKKPLEVEAIQFNADAGLQDKVALLKFAQNGKGSEIEIRMDGLIFKTPNGVQIVRDGDWLVREVDGHLYACHEDLFKATHEKLES